MRSATLSTLALFALAVIAAPSEKRKDKFSPCKNFGDEWCFEGEIVTCKQVPFSSQGWVKSTHKACAAKREDQRSVNDVCNDIGTTWCVGGMIQMCALNRNGIGGYVAATNFNCLNP